VKVVFDTNIYISAFVIPGGNAERAYLHAIEGDFAPFLNLCLKSWIELHYMVWLPGRG